MQWEKANPGLNRIKKLDDLIAKVDRAKNSPRDLTGLLVKDFNVIQTVGTTWLTFQRHVFRKHSSLRHFINVYAIGDKRYHRFNLCNPTAYG